MSGPIILLLDPDPNSRQAIQVTLSKVGIQVAASATPVEMLNLLDSYQFNAILLDDRVGNVDPNELLRLVRERQPNTPLIYIAAQPSPQWIVSAYRNDIKDVLLKPLNRNMVIDSLRRVLGKAHEEHLLREAAYRAQEQLSTSTRPVQRSTIDDDTLFKDILEYHQECLKLFLAMERENTYLQEQLSAATGQNKPEDNSPTDMLIVHDDNSVMSTLQRFSDHYKLKLSQVYTGGEVLDKFGSRSSYDALAISKALPDLDGEMLAESLKSQHPTLEIILLHAWGTNAARGELLSNQEHGSAVFHLRNTQDMRELLNELKARRMQREDEKRFARAFKQRHESFLKRLAEMQVRIEKQM
ncbi:MAG: response regulator [Myxococcota bacterium]